MCYFHMKGSQTMICLCFFSYTFTFFFPSSLEQKLQWTLKSAIHYAVFNMFCIQFIHMTMTFTPPQRVKTGYIHIHVV